MMPLDSADAGREILWNVSALPNSIVMYGLFALSMVVLIWGFWRRVELWAAGRPDAARHGNWLRRIEVAINEILNQRSVNRNPVVASFHSLVFWGFLVLLFTTTMVFIDHDLGFKIFRGRYYLAVTLLSDLFGLGLFIGLMIAFHRRYVQAPDKLHSTRADGVMLFVLALLVVQGFVLEGLRIAATNDPWAPYSPVGWLTAQLFWSMSVPAMRLLHFLMWWFHAVSVFLFFAIIPYSKFFHLFSSSANWVFRDFGRSKGNLKFLGDIEQLLESAVSSDSDGDLKLGIATIEDLTWQQRLELDACTSCGRCQEVCPAYNSGKVLSPKWLILDSRDHMLKLHARGLLEGTSGGGRKWKVLDALDRLDSHLLQSLLVNEHLRSKNGDGQPSSGETAEPSGAENGHRATAGFPFRRAANPLVQQAAKSVGVSPSEPILGGVMEEDVFWSCTTCRACVEVCPVGIHHVDYIMDVRRNQVMLEGNMPSEAQSSLRAIETRGNPFGPAEQRSAWTEGLDVPILEPGASVDILYWVGCVSSYDKRKQKIARSMAQILNASGLSWGILGNRECCTGDPARRLGDENLFQASAKRNLETLQSIQFKTVVSACAHCFNSLKNEYPDLGAIAEDRKVEVLHHSELITRFISEGRIILQPGFDRTITYHDPCYIGRYNDIFEQPREILVQIGATKRREMRDSGRAGLCCGAGGGNYWFDIKTGQRVNVQRVDQAAAVDASVVATACPFCMQMIEDGIKISNREDSMIVRDLAELVAEGLQI